VKLSCWLQDTEMKRLRVGGFRIVAIRMSPVRPESVDIRVEAENKL
jgi:hypothetical protein